MTVGIGDVAQRAGVSVATVSRALRGLPNVSPATRDRVLRAAEDLHYVVDPNASRLAAGRTMTVGMAVPLLTQWYFCQVVAGAEAVLAANGYDVLLYSVAGEQALGRFVRQMPFRKRVDGLIIVELPLGPGEFERIADQQVPVVSVGASHACAPSVMIDNCEAGATATRHLVNLGHERVGLISNLPDGVMHSLAPLRRREGYERVLEESGIGVRQDLIVPGNFSLEGGAEAMARLLAVDRPTTAVFAQSDEMAIGALKTVRDAGLQVPADMSIVGFDNHDMAAYTGLTTVAQPVLQQGETAATLLLGQIESPHQRGDMTSVVMPTKLLVRTTTGPPRAARLVRAGQL